MMQGGLLPHPTHPKSLPLPQVPTPITEMEISVKRVRVAAPSPMSPSSCPTCSPLSTAIVCWRTVWAAW